MYKYFTLMRVKHYVKNFLIFLPLIFAGQLFNIQLLLNAISGEISIRNAIILAIVLGLLAAILNFIFNNTFMAWALLLLYGSINFLYSCGLKKIPLVDITIIVVGFLIRLIYGGEIININISDWMFLTVMSFSFFLALGKRRNEIYNSGYSSREVLRHYKEQFLDKMMYLTLGLSIVFYSLWTITPIQYLARSSNLVWTVPIVLLICMRYCMDIEKDNEGDPAEVLFGDKILLGMLGVYGIVLMVALYGNYLFELQV